jgi:WS/DGAT/MGAT family acyltransferase
VSDPVTVAEAALLARDQVEAPWQHALVLIVAPSLSRTAVISRISERIGYAPRFRRLVDPWPVPGWVDDPQFNLAGHVEQISLAPGQRLQDWLATALSVPLPRRHPLWSVWLVDGLDGGSQAVVVRIHPALVDGYDHIHVFQELLDEFADDITEDVSDDWQPAAAASPEFSTLLTGLADPLAAAGRVAAGVVGLVAGGVRTLTVEPRRHYLEAAEVSLDAVAAVRDAYGVTTHDVLVSLATAGVRAWRQEQGAPLVDEVALIPLAVTEPDVLASAIGCRLAPSFDRLPVSLDNAAERLLAIATLSRARRDSGVSVPARDLVDLAGFAPATLHAVAAGTVGSGRPHTVLVVNVPGPDEPRFLGRSRVSQVHAVTTTSDAEELTVSITSYHRRVSLSAAALAPLDRWAPSIAAELVQLGELAR